MGKRRHDHKSQVGHANGNSLAAVSDMDGPTTLWADGEREFTLEERDGGLELTLRHHGRIVGSELCKNENDARDKAHAWLITLEAMRDPKAGELKPVRKD